MGMHTTDLKDLIAVKDDISEGKLPDKRFVPYQSDSTRTNGMSHQIDPFQL